LYDKILSYIPIVCVDVVIEYEGKILLVKRKNNPAKNQWWFPGGRIYKGESIEQAGVRKGKEEVGLDCVFKEIFGVEETYFKREGDMEFDVHTINIALELQLKNYEEPLLDSDHSEFRWTVSNNKEFHSSIQRILSLKGLKY